MKIPKITLLMCLSTSAIEAQTFKLGSTDGYNMPGGGQIKKTATGEIWNWTITGNGGDHESGITYGTQTGQTDYAYEISFDKAFSIADFSTMRFFGDIDKGDTTALLTVSGGTATTQDFWATRTDGSLFPNGTYNKNTGLWTRIDELGTTNDNHMWDSADRNSTATFTNLRFEAFGLENGDRVSTLLIVDGFVATPEPSSTALLGLGSLGLLLRRRR